MLVRKEEGIGVGERIGCSVDRLISPELPCMALCGLLWEDAAWNETGTSYAFNSLTVIIFVNLFCSLWLIFVLFRVLLLC